MGGISLSISALLSAPIPDLSSLISETSLARNTTMAVPATLAFRQAGMSFDIDSKRGKTGNVFSQVTR